MKNNSLEAWKTFLRGRIAQEQGNDEEALALIGSALQLEPENRHFIVARTISLSRLGRNTESLTSTIVAQYGELARSLSGEKDQPKPWIEGLQNLLELAEGGRKVTAGVVW